jgi:hypothetical protein
VYCRRCKYQLDHLKHTTCPECGRGFDPDDPSSFLPSLVEPRDKLGQVMIVWSSYCAVALGALLLLALVTTILRGF